MDYPVRSSQPLRVAGNTFTPFQPASHRFKSQTETISLPRATGSPMPRKWVPILATNMKRSGIQLREGYTFELGSAPHRKKKSERDVRGVKQRAFEESKGRGGLRKRINILVTQGKQVGKGRGLDALVDFKREWTVMVERGLWGD
ncbi:hypothetical protein FA13DRAFT_1712318 [Coprinellus micaceus]|uniref:Uncharacterized protein n=1 Tax=Coprinellus micaceus TaxID=71717 RepID=A0A4Y7T0X1_COPMI|nr:hypothetical protein FA13DRAFT_1712318 [Coprinellus micaceus]